jgi:hypothetical protein
MRFCYGLAALAATLAAISGAVIAPASAAGPGPLCGTMAGSTPHITKVLWIFMENQSYGTGAKQIPGNPSAPYIDNTLVGQCGSTSDYHAATHPSYPNYLAATSGSTQGTTGDTLGYFSVPSIFSQVDPSWRSYEEFMPVGCDHYFQTGNSTTHQYYVGKHNPAASYSALPVGAPTAGDCPQYDEPLGTTTSGPLVQDVTAGTLPKFSFVTPGLCDDMHLVPAGDTSCPNPVASGDAWLSQWIPILTSGPDYTSGHLVIDVAWDEGSGGTAGEDCVTSNTQDCIVPNIVISPYTKHVVTGTDFSHYSLLKMTETLLGLPYLGAAAGANDLCVPFGLCPPGGAAISFVAAASATGNATSQTVTVPSAVTAGDEMLLLATDVSGTQPLTGPPGWTPISSNAGTAISTEAWSRVAAAGDAGQQVTVGFGGTYKGSLQLLAYSGTSTSAPVLTSASAVTHTTTSSAVTPSVNITGSGNWVVSYWAAKSSAVNAWTLPAGEVSRSTSYGTGGGRIDAIAGDGGAAAPAGSAAGLTATTDQPFSAGTTWTIVLAPGP